MPKWQNEICIFLNMCFFNNVQQKLHYLKSGTSLTWKCEYITCHNCINRGNRKGRRLLMFGSATILNIVVVFVFVFGLYLLSFTQSCLCLWHITDSPLLCFRKRKKWELCLIEGFAADKPNSKQSLKALLAMNADHIRDVFEKICEFFTAFAMKGGGSNVPITFFFLQKCSL